MHFSWKRWRLALVAALTALAFSVAFTSPATAAEPGEDDHFNPEMVSYQGQQVQAQGTLSEARNAGHLLEVWRGATNNQVWLALDNGNPISLGTTATYVSPTVVPYGSNAFMVFHTGVDGNIYYTPFYTDGNWGGQWWQVPNQTTNMTVSVARNPDNPYNLLMVYRGAGNDQRLWAAAYSGGGWTGAASVNGGLSPSAPSLTYNEHTGEFFITARGEDNQVWVTTTYDSGSDWYAWWSEGGDAIDTPHMAAVANGYMLADYLDSNYTVQYRVFDPNGYAVTDWQHDTTGYQTYSPAQLTAYGAAIYVLLTGVDNFVYYKQAYYNNN